MERDRTKGMPELPMQCLPVEAGLQTRVGPASFSCRQTQTACLDHLTSSDLVPDFAVGIFYLLRRTLISNCYNYIVVERGLFP